MSTSDTISKVAECLSILGPPNNAWIIKRADHTIVASLLNMDTKSVIVERHFEAEESPSYILKSILIH